MTIHVQSETYKELQDMKDKYGTLSFVCEELLLEGLRVYSEEMSDSPTAKK